MSGPSASSGEMPGFPRFRKPAPELDDSLLDALLSGDSLPPDAPGQARMMAEMLASLADPAVPGALAGEAAARTAFVRAASPAALSPATRRSERHRHRWVPGSLAARLGAAVAAVAFGLGGAAAAGYAGVLPGAIQELAHHAFGAPAAHGTPAAHGAPARNRSDANPPPAAKRLCADYEYARKRGGRGIPHSELAKLAAAAGGSAKIDGYCTSAGWSRPGHGNARHGSKSKPATGGKRKSREPKPSRSRKAHAHPKSPASPGPHASPTHPVHPA